MPKIFDRKVFELAGKLPDIMPEPFRALEEYDRTLKLRRWGNKVRVNFTLSPEVYGSLKSYCGKEGCKMSAFVERLIVKSVHSNIKKLV
ncbi:MAG TPA: hypothetical protein VI934_05065 [Candidatus Nanoarchaeia archaeon]|nr:hypothetical protein [Candidatus Nanoarchaeia archaeon]